MVKTGAIGAMTETIHVIYVEDEPSIAELLSNGLELFGIKVHPIYTSAEELLENMEDSTEFATADMFVFDIRLPGRTGLELAGELRANGEKRPFIVVSAWPHPSEELLDNLGAVFLPKPFSFPDVVQTIKELVPHK